MTWVPTTDRERQAMLSTIGVESLEDLFDTIPEDLRTSSWEVPPGMSEMAARDLLAQLAAKNNSRLTCFLGGGVYDHFVPAAVDALASRGEFYTAYTPYQPECAQGTLQSIYEYQSAICRLTQMDFANASLYDGGTALFEAVTMSVRLTKRRRALCMGSINPTYRRMLDTHVANLDLDVADVPDALQEPLDDVACVLVQNPDFLGTLHDYSSLAERCRGAGALLVIVFYPVSLGIVKTPGEMGADIAVAEGQCLGMPLNFGGPYLGVMAVRAPHVRKMPGRIGAATVDAQGRRGFVLTLQAREQHIRREKAMSNICSNEALCALRALVYLCLLGKQGLREVAALCHSKAEYLKGRLGFAEVLNKGPTFNEFAIRLPRNAEEVGARMMARGVLAGLPLAAVGAGHAGDLLIAVTERRTREELDAFARVLEEEACS